jgi:hypothetical protein
MPGSRGRGSPPNGRRAPRSPGRSRLAVAGLVLVMVVAGAAIPASSSSDAGRSRDALRRARSELHALDIRLSLVAERLHQGRVLLQTLQGDLVAARDGSERAQRAAADAATRFDATVRWAYETGGPIPGLTAIFSLSSVSEVSQGLDFLSAMAGNQAQLARAAGDARERARQATTDRRSLEAAVSQALEQLRADGSEMRDAVAAQRSLISNLERRLKRQIALAITDRRSSPPLPPTPAGPTPTPSGSGTP